MEALQTFYDKTVKLIELLQQEMERDEQIEQIERLLNEREMAMNHIKPPFSSEQQELGKQLVQLDKQIVPLLKKFKLDIQKDMKQVAIKKESNNKYVNPYDFGAIDGIFYDKRN